jgi:hypothetical protein
MHVNLYKVATVNEPFFCKSGKKNHEATIQVGGAMNLSLTLPKLGLSFFRFQSPYQTITSQGALFTAVTIIESIYITC